MKALFLLITLAAFSGCHGTPVKPIEAPMETGDSLPSPVDLTITEDVNDGERLHIKGSVHALTEWPKENVIVHLVAVKGEEKIGEAYYPLSKSGEKETLAADETLPFSISVPAIEATDYRLELLWGDEAVEFRKTNEPDISSASISPASGVILQSIQSEYQTKDCKDKSNCSGTFVVRGVLQNQGLTKATLVTLAIGLLEKGTKNQLSEDKIRIESLDLPGGGIREVKFDISIPSGVNPLRLEPFVQVVDFEAK